MQRTNPPPPSRRRSSLLPFRPQTAQGLQDYPQSHPPPPTSHSYVPPLPTSPSSEALRRLSQAFHRDDIKRGFDPDSRWSSQLGRHGHAIDTPEEGSLYITQAESSSSSSSQQAPVYGYHQPTHPQYYGHGHGHGHSHGHTTAQSSGHSRRESTSTLRSGHGHGHGFFSQAKSLVRRASTTLSGQPLLKHRRNSNNNNNRQDIPEETVGPSLLTRPTTSYPAGPSVQQNSSGSRRPGFLKRMRSFGGRRHAVSNAPGPSYPESTFPYPLSSSQTYPHDQQQIHQFDWPRPGAAARAAAAAASTSSTMHLASPSLPAAGGRPAQLTRKDTKCSRSTKASTAEHVEMAKRADTAMEVDSVMEPTEIRRDPFEMLPPELTSEVFLHLDFKSLGRAACVSSAWQRQLNPSNVQLWREILLRHYKPVHTMTPLPLQMGGAGIGAPGKQARAWYHMCKTRAELDRNWRRGNARAVYFQGHTDSVYCAQFDETKIITGSRDKTIRVWDIETKQCLRVVGGGNNRPQLPSAGESQLEVHSQTTHPGTNLNGTPAGDALFLEPNIYHNASVLCLQFDDEILVTGSSDSTCIVWDVNTFRPIYRLDKHTAGVLDVCFDNRFIISCSKDNKICIWNRANGELMKVLHGHHGPVNAVQMRGDLLVSASGDGMSKLWCLKKFECIRDYQSRDRGLAAVEFSDDGKFILAGGNDQVIYKYNVETAELVHTYAGHQGLVRSLFLDSQNNRVVSGSYDQAMRVYDFQTGESLGGDPVRGYGPSTPSTTPAMSTASDTDELTGSYENWTTSWILSAKSDYRRIVATSQDGRALLMDFGYGLDPMGLKLLKGTINPDEVNGLEW